MIHMHMALYGNSAALVVRNPQSSAPFFDPQQLMIQVFNLLSMLWRRVSKLLHVAGLLSDRVPGPDWAR